MGNFSKIYRKIIDPLQHVKLISLVHFVIKIENLEKETRFMLVREKVTILDDKYYNDGKDKRNG